MSPLRKIRVLKEMSLDEAAAGIGINPVTLSRIELSRVWPPKKTVEKIIKFYENEITKDEILWPEHYQ